jgi:hypothetical protein
MINLLKITVGEEVSPVTLNIRQSFLLQLCKFEIISYFSFWPNIIQDFVELSLLAEILVMFRRGLCVVFQTV